MDQHLKESLRKYTCVGDKRIYVPDIIVALLKSKFNSETLQYDNSELKILIDFIREDYLKEKQLMMLEKRLAELISDARQAGMSCRDFVDMATVLYEGK